MAKPAVDFVELVRKSYDAAVGVAIDAVNGTAKAHHNLWRDTFEHADSMAAGDSGLPGSAPPLAEQTIAKRSQAGDPTPDKMLDSPTDVARSYPVSASRALKDSLELHEAVVEGDEERLTFRASAASIIDHPVFQINEFGGEHPVDGSPVPMRATLLPVDDQISAEFEDNLIDALHEALTEVARK